MLLGTKFTNQADFYGKEALDLGLEIKVPNNREQNIINNIIMDELVHGKFLSISKDTIIDIIKNYKVDAVILGCTELPLLIHQEDLTIQLLDTLKIHVNAALNIALSD